MGSRYKLNKFIDLKNIIISLFNVPTKGSFRYDVSQVEQFAIYYIYIKTMINIYKK